MTTTEYVPETAPIVNDYVHERDIIDIAIELGEKYDYVELLQPWLPYLPPESKGFASSLVAKASVMANVSPQTTISVLMEGRELLELTYALKGDVPIRFATDSLQLWLERDPLQGITRTIRQELPKPDSWDEATDHTSFELEKRADTARNILDLLTRGLREQATYKDIATGTERLKVFEEIASYYYAPLVALKELEEPATKDPEPFRLLINEPVDEALDAYQELWEDGVDALTFSTDAIARQVQAGRRNIHDSTEDLRPNLEQDLLLPQFMRECLDDMESVIQEQHYLSEAGTEQWRQLMEDYIWSYDENDPKFFDYLHSLAVAAYYDVSGDTTALSLLMRLESNNPSDRSFPRILELSRARKKAMARSVIEI